MSVKKYTSSVENLLKRAVKAPESPKSILPVVDLYNAISVKYQLPFGAFDMNSLGGELLELRFTKDGDLFQALDEPEPSKVPAGEVTYVVGNDIVTRHINWKQSRLGLVEEGSTDLVFMAELLSDVTKEEVDVMCADFVERSRVLLNCEPSVMILDTSLTTVEF